MPPAVEDIKEVEGTEATQFRPYTLTEARNGSATRPIRIFADGVFDLFHYGHAQFLRQIRDEFPDGHIVVGVFTDADIARFKGAPPVLSADQRREALESSGLVDEIWWATPFDFKLSDMDGMRIDLVAHDKMPYPMPDANDFYAAFRKADRFFETRRTGGISTSSLIKRIVDNAELYAQRPGVKDTNPVDQPTPEMMKTLE